MLLLLDYNSLSNLGIAFLEVIQNIFSLVPFAILVSHQRA